jgi:hypothetical protein
MIEKYDVMSGAAVWCGDASRNEERREAMRRAYV